MAGVTLDRRALLGGLPALALAGCGRASDPLVPADLPDADTRLQDLPFLGEGELTDGDEGTGLDGRRTLDLAALLDADDLVVQADAFFLRTFRPVGHDPSGWTVALPEGAIDAGGLMDASTDQGVVLLECSGNNGQRRFGLISAGRWSGVPLMDLLDLPGDPLIEIAGDDHHPPSTHSQPGASWILRASELVDAFLATGLDGAPLSADAGAPVRLIVPGCYGCAAIKWVRSIAVVPEDAPATAQMREFAVRTHQDAAHERAADYRAPRAEASALAVRVGVHPGNVLRIDGLAWGRRSGTLDLHLGARVLPGAIALTGPDTTWERWSVAVDASDLRRGEIDVRLTASPEVPQVRLDSGRYTRTVRWEGPT